MPTAKKNDLAYRLLKRRILAREYMPGDRVVVNRVSDELGISVIPVREALARLESEGLVEIRPYAGAVVTSVNSDEILRIMELTGLLEGYATRLALPNAGRIVNALERANRDMMHFVEHEAWAEFAASNKQFHIAVYSACGNQTIIDSLQSLWNKFTALSPATLFHLMPERARESVAEHQSMIELLADPSSDPLQLEILARNHKLRTLHSYASGFFTDPELIALQLAG